MTDITTTVNAAIQPAAFQPDDRAELITSSPALLATATAMIAAYNMESAMSDHELAMFTEACRRFQVTKAEFEEAYWKAYADKFTGKRMYFRHIWTHIQAAREAGITNQPIRFTTQQVEAWLLDRKIPLTIAYRFFDKADDYTYTLKEAADV